MKNKKQNIAIFSPSQNPYSETFIQAHKIYLKDEVFYYYGRGQAICLEGFGPLASKWKNRYLRGVTKLFKKPPNYIRDKILEDSFKKHSIDAVLVEYGTHAHDLRGFLSSCGLPVITHFHGFDASQSDVIESCNQYKEVFALSTKIVAVSKAMEQRLLGLGCPRAKLVYNVYGPQPEFESVVPRFSKKQFIGIGRFTDKKAPYYSIMAFKQVLTKHPDAKLLLAGNGSLFGACKNFVRYYGLEENVLFLGVIKPETYREILSESLAFVQHSITAFNGDMEGTPLAILEASSAGLPVISTNHAGIPDVIAHEETGLLVDEHDVDGMAVHMLRVLDDVNYAKELGKAGNLRIAKYFSLKRHIDALQDILTQI